MPVFNNALAGASGQGSGGSGYVIEKSLRFTPGDTAFLSRSATDSGDVYKYTVSWWMKIGGISTDRTIISFATNNAVDGWTKIHLRTNNRLAIFGDSTGTALSIRPSMVFRDPNAWYHCVVALDTTQSTYSDQAKFWINGVQQTDFDGTTAFATNTALSIGKATTHHVGVEPDSVGSLRNYFNGYIANLQVVEGQALDETTFGEFDDNGVWKPKEVNSSLFQPVVSAGTGAQSLYNLGSDLSTKASPATFRTDSNASNLQIAVAGDNSDEVSHSIRGSGSALTLTTSGVTFNQAGKFYNDAFLIQNAGAHCSVAETTAAKPGTSDFCVEFWINPTTTPSNSGLFSYGDYNSAGSFGMMTTGNNSLRVDMHDGNSQTGSALTVANGLQTGWQHFALTRSGTTCTLYRNGTSQGTWTIDASADFTPTGSPYFVIGNRLGLTFSNYNITSYFQDFRVYVGTAKYTANFTVPSQTGGNSFHLNFADGTNDAAGSNNWTAHNLIVRPYEAVTSDVTVFKQGAVDNTVNKLGMFDGNKASFTYAAGATASNYIEWAPTGGYTTPGYIWIQGGDGGGGGVQNMTVTINGTTVTRTAVVDNETYSSASYDWGNWSKFTVSGDTLNTLRLTGANALIRGLSTVADPTHSVLGISDDDNVPTIRAGDGEDLDIYVDSPTNGDPDNDTEAGGVLSGNYCTWNPLSIYNGGGTMLLEDGNLNFGDQGNASKYGSVAGTIAVNSGKWFFEVTYGSGTGVDTNSYVGILPVEVLATTNSAAYFNVQGCLALRGVHAYKKGATQSSDYALGLAIGDTISVAFDCDNGTSTWYLNGTSLGTFPHTFDTQYSWTPFASDWSNGQPVSEYILNCGQRPFSMTPPTGYKAICTANLPTSDVPDGSDYFDTELYDGTGAAQTISGLSFSPDLVWLKRRSSSESNTLFDTVRGAGKELISESTSAQYDAGTSSSGSLIAFNNDGFDLGSRSSVNGSSTTNVAWAWDAGTSDTTVSAGGLNSSVYDQSQTWSTLDTWPSASYSTASSHVFNGVYGTQNTSDFWYSSGASTVDLSNLATALGTGVTNITIWIFDRSGDVTLTVNNATTTESQDNAYQEISIDHDESAITTFTIQGTDSSYWGIGGIKVNGRLLVDSGVSVTNVPSIASTVRANQAAGFSIVTFTASSSQPDTVGHGLNAKPYLIITKDRDASPRNWWTWHIGIDEDDVLKLDSTDGKSDMTDSWSPNSSTFQVQGVATSGNDHVAYCFAPVEGYSAFGSYTGSGNNDGVFVHTNFRVKYLLTKPSSAGGDWMIWDAVRQPYNVNANTIQANTNAAEAGTSGYSVDLLSNGFKFRMFGSSSNASGVTYIWAAFAEHPFQANGGLAR